MRPTLLLFLLFVALPASAALVGYDGYVDDTDSGLQWLRLDETFGLTRSQALAANSGWRYATNSEVEDLFWKAFDGYYSTNGSSYSSSAEGAYADQVEDVLAYGELFGVSGGRTIGYYEDEDGIIRLMGGFEINAELYTVYGPEFVNTYSETSSSIYAGTYLVRSSLVPAPAAVWLFGSALAGLGWLRRKHPTRI